MTPPAAPGGGDFSARLATAHRQAQAALEAARPALEARAERVTGRLAEAYRQERVSQADFAGSTGYGYDAPGRDKLDRLLAHALGAEAAAVRPQWASGTAALAAMLWAVARPGGEILVATGEPYDTLASVLGEGDGMGLSAWGVRTRWLTPPSGAAMPPPEAVREALSAATVAVYLQRSSGYAHRPPLAMAEVAALAQALRVRPEVRLVVDNCYGEFTEELEPPAVGAFLTAGSLIKNPGGGLAPVGGYVAGDARGVERALARLTAPGQAREVGAWPEGLRPFFQGLLWAPQAVAQCLAGSVYAAAFWRALGGGAWPAPEADRRDLVVRLEVGDPERLVAAAEAIQAFSPVDSHARPRPEAMPGYRDPVVMAGGTFVQGSTLELSADAPLRPPYLLYLQCGPSLALLRPALEAAARAVFAG